MLASVNRDGVVQVWHADKGILIDEPLANLDYTGSNTLVFHDNQTMVVGQKDGLVVLREDGGEWLPKDAVRTARPRFLQSKNGVIFSVGRAGIAAYALESGRLVIRKRPKDERDQAAHAPSALRDLLSGSVTGCHILEKDDLAVFTTLPGKVVVWDLLHQIELFSFDTLQGGIKRFTLRNDGTLITCGVDGSIKIWPIH